MGERLAHRDGFSRSHTAGARVLTRIYSRGIARALSGSVSGGLGSQACANVRVRAAWRRVRPALVVRPDQGPVARCGESGSARFPSYLSPPALLLHTPSAETSPERLRTRLLLGPPRLLPAKVSAGSVSLPRREVVTASVGGGGPVATSGLRLLLRCGLVLPADLRQAAGPTRAQTRLLWATCCRAVDGQAQ